MAAPMLASKSLSGVVTDSWKIHISRVPTTFAEGRVCRILTEKLKPPPSPALAETKADGGDDDTFTNGVEPIRVELIYPRPEKDEDNDDVNGRDKAKAENRTKEGTIAGTETNTTTQQEHRGFGFVTFSSQALHDAALKLGTVKGGRKPTSKRQHTMHLRPYVDDAKKKDGSSSVCYLWSLFRCPYGEQCKFEHQGEGGCVGKSYDAESKKGKCFAFKKTQHCAKGDACLFSHDFEPKIVRGNKKATSSASRDTTAPVSTPIIPKSERDCINWKTKGKCRKGDECPYRHDLALQKKALAKERQKKELLNDDGRERTSCDNNNHQEKTKQPLSVRVFGLNYETTEDDVRTFFKECGTITNINFPTFADSGRSKGFCGVWFASPKAAEKALELDGSELHGRWLRIQSGKMIRQWKDLHQHREHTNVDRQQSVKSSSPTKRARLE